VYRDWSGNPQCQSKRTVQGVCSQYSSDGPDLDCDANTDGPGPSPQLGGGIRRRRFPCSSIKIACSGLQEIQRYEFRNAQESWGWLRQGSLIRENFPVFSLHIRDLIRETSSPQTQSTAIESACAKTLRLHPELDREIHAIPRGFGRWGCLIPNQRRRARGSMSADSIGMVDTISRAIRAPTPRIGGNGTRCC
jgi:hypothetical protein